MWWRPCAGEGPVHAGKERPEPKRRGSHPHTKAGEGTQVPGGRHQAGEETTTHLPQTTHKGAKSYKIMHNTVYA